MFAKLLLAHLIGDYFVQTDWMAMNKTKNTLDGWSACFFHSALYSLVIMIAMTIGAHYSTVTCLEVFGFVFLTHFPIDKFSLAKYLLKLKGNDITRTDALFWVVYIAVDNGTHLILMCLGLTYWFNIKF